jgi:hypothetical protein
MAIRPGKPRTKCGYGATLLAVVVRELYTFVADAIDVRRAVAHLAVAEGTDVPHEDQKIGLLVAMFFPVSRLFWLRG